MKSVLLRAPLEKVHNVYCLKSQEEVFYIGCSKCGIGYVLSGKFAQLKGYKWKYTEEVK